jgi:putative hemolysin
MVETVPDAGNLYTYGILFAVSVALCALFSFLETSITAIRLYQLKELAQSTGRYSKLLQSLEQNQSRVLTTILLANNLSSVLAATTGTWFTETLFRNLPESVNLFLGILLTTAVILVVGEVIPKNIAKALGERLFQSTLWITNITYYALYPIVTLFLALSDYIIFKIRGKHEEEVLTSEKEIRFLIDYINQKGLLEEEKTAMLKSIFELGTTSVKDIMIPAPSIISINVDAPITDALAIFKKHQFSRLPVYDNRIDNIIGMLHLKDLFAVAENKSIKDILRPMLFIPESIKVNQLLKEFKEQHMHIAIVLDEHGSIVGLVTLEDVLEEIVGEIQDEYEASTEKIVQIKEGTWLVDASIELQELEKHLKIKFETEDALTLAGFLAEQLQQVPRKGNRLSYKGYQFQIQQASAKRAVQVLIFAENRTEKETSHT